jgi:hypothetical protein
MLGDEVLRRLSKGAEFQFGLDRHDVRDHLNSMSPDDTGRSMEIVQGRMKINSVARAQKIGLVCALLDVPSEANVAIPSSFSSALGRKPLLLCTYQIARNSSSRNSLGKSIHRLLDFHFC